MGIRRWLTDRLVVFLTEPLSGYERRGWNDPEALRRHIRKGDVLLVDGDSRVSAIIKYLTQSSWSHAALYIGDELLKRGGERAKQARRAFGDEADHLLVEALPQGVVASPVSKYIDFNIRLVRPHRLRAEHLRTILDDHIAAIGWRYDLRNVLDLARYMLPVSLIPYRLRRAALHFGSGVPTEVICSSLLGQIFQKVRFPIVPVVEFPPGEALPERGWSSVLRRVFGYDSHRYTGVFRMRHPTLLTPRDFDLSPYFNIVKFNVIADGDFDYTKIHWAAQEPGAGGARPVPGDGGRDEAVAPSPADRTGLAGDLRRWGRKHTSRANSLSDRPNPAPSAAPSADAKLPAREKAEHRQEVLKSRRNSPR